MSLHKLTWILGSLVVLTLVGCLYRSSPVTLEEESRSEDAIFADSKDPSGVRKERLKELTPEISDVVRSNSDFALALYARLHDANRGRNLFFSPYSVSSALALVVEGARGETAEQMGKVLGYGESLHRGGDARDNPWDTARLHTAMGALNDELAAGTQAAPKEVREQIAALRKQLQDANEQATELRKKRDWNGANRAADKGRRIAAELNQLQGRYGQYELRIANALWGENTYLFRKDYLDTLHKYYHTGGLFPVDFRNDFEGARLRINAWVEEQTKARIQNMTPKDVLDEEAKKLVRLILTNAIYFKGEWAEVFQEAQTKDEDFFLSGGGKARVPLMRRSDLPGVRYAAFNGDGTYFDTPSQIPRGGRVEESKLYPDEHGFTLLEMPYKGGELSMVAIAPRSADGLAELDKKLTGDNLQAWMGKLRQRSVHVFMPRFKLETNYAMEAMLQAMGMKRAFKDPRAPDGAQFDGMSQSEDPAQKLYISKVLHKAFVEVNEKGTEAAAATAVIMAKPTAAPVSIPFTPTFRADRPFVFLIRDVKTGSILFLGRMMNPKQS
jgi:serine protease inhibitor